MKPINTVVAATLAIKSLADAAYQQSILGEKVTSVVRYVMEKVPSFPEELPEESRKELVTGYIRRKHELMGVTNFAVISGQVVNVASLQKVPEGAGLFDMSVHIAMGYSTHEFGKLQETHSPEYKAIVKQMRDVVSTFISNSIRQLTSQAKAIRSKGDKRERSKTSDFGHWLVEDKGWLDTGTTRCVNASKRGDPTADVKRFKAAKLAFLNVWEAAN